MDKDLLVRILLEMDVPAERRELTSGNVRWLLSNLGFRNSRHQHYKRAREILKKLYKEQLSQQTQDTA